MIEKKYFRYLKFIFLFMGISIQLISYKAGRFNLFTCGMLLVMVHNILFSFEDYAERFIYFLFNVTYFTFLMSRPVIGMLRGEIWWRAVTDADEYIWFALWLVSIGLYTIFLGGYFAVIIHKKMLQVRRKKKVKVTGQGFKEHLQVVSMLVFYISLPFFLLQEIEPLIFASGKGYLSYYSEFESQLPGLFHTFASFMKISLCVFLSTCPRKRRAFMPLALYELSAIPALIIGVRNPLMLNSLFILVYYLLRDAVENREKWLGKIEKILISVATPFVLMFMTAYAYIRGGHSIGLINPFKYIVDFFYSQGVTFNVIQAAYGYVGSLRLHISPYTFGGIVDYIYYGTIGQKIWGTEALPVGNCLENAQYSHNLSHHLSYVSLRDSYLNGRGWGSSYLLETFVDYGYVGVLIFGLIIGILLIYFVYWFGNRTFLTTIVLLALTSIFLIPRAEATGWLTFIVTVQFWACIAGCYFGGFILSRCKGLQKIFKKLKLYSEKYEE